MIGFVIKKFYNCHLSESVFKLKYDFLSLACHNWSTLSSKSSTKVTCQLQTSSIFLCTSTDDVMRRVRILGIACLQQVLDKSFRSATLGVQSVASSSLIPYNIQFSFRFMCGTQKQRRARPVLEIYWTRSMMALTSDIYKKRW